jgi:hypothetical protein
MALLNPIATILFKANPRALVFEVPVERGATESLVLNPWYIESVQEKFRDGYRLADIRMASGETHTVLDHQRTAVALFREACNPEE